jgi:hypothetical protein
MRATLLFFAAILAFSVFAALPGRTADVRAVGASTNNATTPNFPVSDQSQDEIKPLVNCVLLGPTSQSKTTPPKVILDFMGASKQDKFKITAYETWCLEIDINAPGWLYIYEYFPAGNNTPGRWIAYKWQLVQSGLWELGPFTPANNELEGQHIYKVWFYSDGYWAEEDSNASQNTLVYWTYSKGPPDAQAPLQPPVAPVKEPAFLERLHSFITNPIAWALGVLILVILASFYVSRRYIRWGRCDDTVSLADDADTEGQSNVVPSAAAISKLSLPNGMEIPLAGNSRIIGRGDLARALGLDELGLISRQHFEVKSELAQFYIEDLGSANGTRLNGTDISGKGPVNLNDNDVIEPAGIVRLTFYII